MEKHRAGGDQTCALVSHWKQRRWVSPELNEEGLGARPGAGCHNPYKTSDREGWIRHPSHRPLWFGFAINSLRSHHLTASFVLLSDSEESNSVRGWLDSLCIFLFRVPILFSKERLPQKKVSLKREL